MLGETTSDLGGYKDATLSIASKGDSADGVWSRLKFEGGVHRVQRVPVTESQGRVHTSAAGVLVYPEPEEVEQVQIDESDLRIDVYRSSGKGGQGVNTTDSAVRITHLPTGIVVTCQNERSQLQNKARALQVLAARLQSLAEEQAQADASADRASQIRTVDRSERIRTYNFPENRIADHRIGFKSHNLDQVLDGDLDPLFDALAAADKQVQAATGMMRLRRRDRRTPPPVLADAGIGSAAGRRRATRRARRRHHRGRTGDARRTRRRILQSLRRSHRRARASAIPLQHLDRYRRIRSGDCSCRPRRLHPAAGDRSPAGMGLGPAISRRGR